MSFPTRPWLAPYGPAPGEPGVRARYVHAQAFFAGAPQDGFALCAITRRVTVERPDLIRCPSCVEVLRRHGLWPL